MRKSLLTIVGAIALFMTYSCESNPLLKEWDTPFGIPPFEEVRPEHYMPAFLKAMDEHKAEIDAIVNCKEEPNFENTILPYDKAGSLYSKVAVVFSSESGVNSSDAIMAISRELSPIQSAHFSEISLNDALFQRIKAVYDKSSGTAPYKAGLDLEIPGKHVNCNVLPYNGKFINKGVRTYTLNF
mgnify:CR=1 FL=1